MNRDDFFARALLVGYFDLDKLFGNCGQILIFLLVLMSRY